MGKVTGFMEFQRLAEASEQPQQRVKHYREFVGHLSDDEAKIEARIGAWGRNCKSAVADKFKAKSMADVEVSLSASLRAGIDAGEITLKDIKRSGLSFDFRAHHVPGKDPEGYCNTDGQGNVDEIRNMHD